MTGLPPGVERREFDGDRTLATAGPAIGEEPTAEGWREWSIRRSKVASMLERGLPIALDPGSTVLYLGAASGTTVSHVADVTAVTYAVEFAPRPMQSLIAVARDRDSLIPLLKDARNPTSYAHVVESDLDLLIQDVATRGQARVAVANRQFLADDGQLILTIKARSEDVSAAPAAVFEEVLATLEETYSIEETERLEPHHADHLAVLARPR